jgi:hypothetical protein
MARWKSGSVRQPGTGTARPPVSLLAMAGVSAAVLALLAAAVPPILVLPVVCLLAIAAAGMVSLLAWRAGVAAQQQRVTAWDVAGALVFIGFAAAILSDPHQAAAHLLDTSQQ